MKFKFVELPACKHHSVSSRLSKFTF